MISISNRSVVAPVRLPRRLFGGVLLALLPIEVGVIAARFDAAPITEHFTDWWALALGSGGALAPFVLAMATSILLFARDRGDEGTAERALPTIPWLWLAVHALVFASFYAASAQLFSPTLAERSSPAFWGALWLAVGVGVVATWAVVVFLAGALPRALILSGRVLGTVVAVGVLAWIAGSITELWWEPLRELTLWGSYGLVRLVTPTAYADPKDFLLGAQDFLVIVGKECSGTQGIGLMMVFVGSFAWMHRDDLRLGRALATLPFLIVLSWIANVVRIASLVLIGAYGSKQVAIEGFHANSGSLLFCAVALGAAAWMTSSRLFAKNPIDPAVGDEAGEAESRESEILPLVVPLLVVISASMIAGAFTTEQTPAIYALRVGVLIPFVWWYRRAYAELGWAGCWRGAPFGVVGFLAWIALVPENGGATSDALLAAAGGDPSAIFGAAVRLTGYVVVAPLAEELAFRGYLTRQLVASDFRSAPVGTFTWVSFLGSSFLFGLMHDQLLGATVAGAIFALALYWRRSLADAIIAHAVTNLMVVLYVAATGRWSAFG